MPHKAGVTEQTAKGIFKRTLGRELGSDAYCNCLHTGVPEDYLLLFKPSSLCYSLAHYTTLEANKHKCAICICMVLDIYTLRKQLGQN